MIDLRVTDRFRKINLFQHVSKLKRPRFGVHLVALARLKSFMVAFAGLFQLAKNFFKAFLTNALLGFRCDLYFAALVIFSNVSFIFQVI